MELDKVITLIQAVSDSALTGFILEEGNLHLELQKVPYSGVQVVEKTKASFQEVSHTANVLEQTSVKEECLKENVTGKQEKSEEEVPIGTPVCSPLVGTFYSAPSEGEAPFVRVGDRVTKGQVLGIIEAMKLMNEIECEQDGVVTAILVENGEMVEYGQKLFFIQ